MLKQKSRLTLAVVLVAATLLIAGGVAVASNTGFKINMPLPTTQAGSPNIGNTWLSLPYFNPYTNGNVLCTQLGLRTGIGGASLLKTDPVTGVSTPGNCGSAATFTWSQGQGVRVRNAAGAGAPTSAIIVGSHNPSLSFSIPSAGSGDIGNFWFAVPYHTTAITGQDLCNSVGLTSTGSPALRGSLLRNNGATGATTPGICGSTASNITLVLGEAIRLRQPGGLASFTPAHF